MEVRRMPDKKVVLERSRQRPYQYVVRETWEDGPEVGTVLDGTQVAGLCTQNYLDVSVVPEALA